MRALPFLNDCLRGKNITCDVILIDSTFVEPGVL